MIENKEERGDNDNEKDGMEEEDKLRIKVIEGLKSEIKELLFLLN